MDTIIDKHDLVFEVVEHPYDGIPLQGPLLKLLSLQLQLLLLLCHGYCIEKIKRKYEAQKLHTKYQ